jgi:hypothetical protein
MSQFYWPSNASSVNKKFKAMMNQTFNIKAKAKNPFEVRPARAEPS